MSTTVLPCPKCGLPARLREGETSAQCTGCGTTVRSPRGGGQEPGSSASLRQTVLTSSLLLVAAGFGGLALARHHRAARAPTPAPPTAIYTAPPAPAVVPTPEGELAWEPSARAPVLTRINADDVDDIVGFFKVWDGRSAWAHYAGAFDGATLKLLWQSEPVDPQLIKQPGVAPIAVVLGRRVVIGDASPTLRVFDVRSGEKLSTLQLMGPVMDVCPMPNSADRIWIRVADGGDTVFDLATEKSDPGPRPKGCPEPQYENTTIPKPPVLPTPKDLQAITDKTAEVLACDRTFENAMLARASCHAPASSPPAADASTSAGFVAAYELSDGSGLSVALGTKSSRPVASSTTKGAPWERELVPADTKAKLGAPPVADLAFERLYVVSERVYFDARLTALDAHTGAVVWEAPLTGSLPRSDGSGRGDARALVTTAARVYVVRAGGALDVFDASSGKPAGSIGKQ